MARKYVVALCIILTCCMRLCVAATNTNNIPVRRNSELPLPASSEPDELGAINALFRRLDDDANGNIDRAESDEFLKEELSYAGNGAADKRHKNFHANGTDAHITVDELISMWNGSAVRNWSSDDVVDWLSRNVGLDIYEEHFRKALMTGRFMPLLAVNSDDIIGRTIGIQNVIHKNKIMLKATDVVLFGPPEADRLRKYKDAALTTALVGIVGFALLYRLQQRRHQSQMARMNVEFESLLKTEQQWRDMQSNGVTQEHGSPGSDSKQHSFDDVDRDRLHHAEAEVIALRQALRAAEARQHAEHKSDAKWSAPYDLIVLLQLTYAFETENYMSRKAHAEAQLQEARICCERLRKRRGLASLIAPIRYATTSLPEELDTRIADAKVALQEVMEMCHERKSRWGRIEVLVNAAVVHSGHGVEQLKSMVAQRRNNSVSHGHNSGWRRNSQHSLLSSGTTTAAVAASHQPPVHNSTSSVTLDHFQPRSSHAQQHAVLKPNRTSSSLSNNGVAVASPTATNDRDHSLSSSHSVSSGGAGALGIPSTRHHTLSGIVESPLPTPQCDRSARPIFDNDISMDSIPFIKAGDNASAVNGFCEEATRIRLAAEKSSPKSAVDPRILNAGNHLNIPNPSGVTKRSNTFVAATNFNKLHQHASADAADRSSNDSPVECFGTNREDIDYNNVEFTVRDSDLKRHKNSLCSASSGHLPSTAATAAASHAEHNRKVLETGSTLSKPAANGLKHKRSFVNLFRHHKSDKDLVVVTVDKHNKHT